MLIVVQVENVVFCFAVAAVRGGGKDQDRDVDEGERGLLGVTER